MAVDPNTGAVYDYFKQGNPDVIDRYTYLADQLDIFLAQNNWNLVDLYRKVAIRYF